MRKGRILKMLLLVAAFIVAPCGSTAQTFKSSHLKVAYEKLHLGSQSPASQRLSIRKDANGTIEHIGVMLFSEEIRTLLPSPIYDYLEYALLNHKYGLSENTLQEQKIRFRHGSWSDLERITPEVSCTIDNLDDKWYVITWARPGTNPLSVAIPIDYELLANSSRKEMEANFARDLRKYKPKAPRPFTIEADGLQSLHRDGILMKKGHSYLTPELNSNLYFKLMRIKERAAAVVSHNGATENVTLEEDVPVLLRSARHPRETWANILLTPHHADVKARLSLDLLFAGYHKDRVDVTLQQWMGYCQAAGCSPYYIYEGTSGNQGSAVLLMHNRGEGYAHMVCLHCDVNSLESRSQTYSGKVYMYIPTSNIKDLFEKATSRKSTPKTYE